MTKTLAIKKRHILFKFIGPQMSGDEVKRLLFNEALKFFGELGFAELHLKFLEFNEEKQKGIITCNRNYFEKMLGFLVLVQVRSDSLDPNQILRFHSLKASGTIHNIKKSSPQ